MGGYRSGRANHLSGCRRSTYWVSALLAAGITFAGVLTAQSVSATSSPQVSDPECTSDTNPQSGGIVEICATPTGLTFAWANEPLNVLEGVSFQLLDNTSAYYQYEVAMPTSGSQCALNSGPGFNTRETSCNFSVSLPDGVYLGSASLTNGQSVKVPFALVVSPGDQPLPTLPTSPPASSGCIGDANDYSISGLAASYAGKGGSTDGYWKVSTEGGVYSCGGAVPYGSMWGKPLDQPITGIVSTPDGGGYWLVANDGGTFAFGDAGFYGSMGGTPLNERVVSMAPTPDNRGYWLVASDGGIFAFGDAQFYGSMGGKPLNKPIVGIAATPDGGGYWLVASDGGIFAFGDAQFYGSMGGKPLNKPIVGMVASLDGGGYFLVASDGGIFAFGDAVFSGSTGGNPPSTPVVGVAVDVNGGYWLITSGSGSGVPSFPSETISFGGAPTFG